jgi:hypothetical protein
VTGLSVVRADEQRPDRWRSPLAGRRFDVEPRVRPAEAEAVRALGVRNLRKLQYHDPHAPGWRTIRRLTLPPEIVNDGLDSPPTPHRRRAMLDVVALLLTRCAESGRTFWDWSHAEWADLLGRTQDEFRRQAPPWVGDEVRPYLAAHAYLIGGFTAFHELGSFQRLTLAHRIFGQKHVEAEISRVRAVLAGWGYRLGDEQDTLLPMVACQVFLLAGSPHLEELSTELFERMRAEKMLPASRGNTLYAIQRAVAALGFCDPPASRTGRHSQMAHGGPAAWQQWVDRWYATSTLTPRARGGIRSNLLKAGRLGRGGTSRGRRTSRVEPPDVRGVGRGGGPDERWRLRPAHHRARARQAAPGGDQGPDDLGTAQVLP